MPSCCTVHGGGRRVSPWSRSYSKTCGAGDTKTLEQAFIRLHKYLYDDDDAKFAANQKAIFQDGRHLAIVSVMKEHYNCRILQIQCSGVLEHSKHHSQHWQGPGCHLASCTLPSLPPPECSSRYQGQGGLFQEIEDIVKLSSPCISPQDPL